MKTTEQYTEINRISWNARTIAHIDSDFYDNESFLHGKSSLNSIELEKLGDVSGKSILHLQCHFGQDTLSLSRLGAQTVGIDLSDKAIETAKKLAAKTALSAQFICSDVYDLPQHLHQKFDVVFTSYGVIGWLPDLDQWAQVIAHFLKLGGKLVFVEFHPVVWMFDDDFERVGYRYFNSGPIIETESGSYAARDADFKLQTITWNHALSEVFSALLKNNLQISSFDEYDYSPYSCFKNTIEFEPGKFRIPHLQDKIPMVYAIVAEKA